MITEVMHEGVLEDLPAQERDKLMLIELTEKLERSENQRIAMEKEYYEKYSKKLSDELSKKDRLIEKLQKKLDELEEK